MTTTPTTTPATGLAEGFKAAFRHHPAGIAVITTTAPTGPAGLTASSVASVGLDPLALAFSVTRATGSAGLILNADTYLVHLLDAHHVEIARQFALPGGDRFTAAQEWQTLPTGEPLLTGARAALRCRTLHTVPVGASSLIVAEVLDIHPGTPGEPMIYHDRTFCTAGEPL
jgi:flavin reductase (DIM6/NTAB) family NADH-FMN oxidoreductase RutF